jgi:hypothetical protein
MGAGADEGDEVWRVDHPPAGLRRFDELERHREAGGLGARDLWHHGGRIAEANRLRSPVASSVRLSLTRGATTSTAPAEVTTRRASARQLRTTNRRPRSSN